MTPLTRRAFLQAAALGVGGWLSGCGGRAPTSSLTAPPLIDSPTATPSTLDGFLTTPAPNPQAGQLTPIDRLYIQTYSKDLEPLIDLDTYRLTVTGLVQTPLALTWADLQTLPELEHMQTLECIGNPVGGHLIGNILWKGIALRAVLEQAALQANARYLVMSSADEYFTSVPLDLALSDSSLLAFAANGEPLPPAHGFPLRVLLPGVYGQKQPKWITGLRLAEDSEPGTWEKQGWSDTAIIQINSRIDYPPANSLIPAGQPIQVSGIAFADTSGVAQVEVSTDGGDHWQIAQRLPGPSTQVWTAWQFEWASPTVGSHSLQARATDGNGQIQVAGAGILAGVFPAGTAAIHSIVVTVA